MPFATDRSLLILEPNLFVDITPAALQLLHLTDATVAGTTLSTLQGNLITASITPGQVILLNNAPAEIIEILSANTATVSRLRMSVDDDPIPPLSGMSITAVVYSFNPQIETAHQLLMSAFTVRSQGVADQVDTTHITNQAEVERVEALGALHVIYAGASLLLQDNPIVQLKADLYKDRYQMAREQLVLLLDSDEDGEPDASRNVNTATWSRV